MKPRLLPVKLVIFLLTILLLEACGDVNTPIPLAVSSPGAVPTTPNNCSGLGCGMAALTPSSLTDPAKASAPAATTPPTTLKTATVTARPTATTRVTRPTSSPSPTRTPVVKISIPGVVTYTGLSQNHATGKINYPQSPPVGGPHNPIWQNCGIYDQPVFNENAVHSLEHGAVWITYQPDLAEAAIEQLKTLVRGRGYILLAPYVNLDSPVVASAWGVQLKLDSASDLRLDDFISLYRQGPQTPEPGASCTGGVGIPDEL